MNISKTAVLLLVLISLPILPCGGMLNALTVPSDTVQEPTGDSSPVSGGYFYYYDTSDHLLLFLETALYIGLALAALIIIDEHTDGLTIIIYD